MYNRDQIEQVRAALDIVEVIRTYVPSLKAAGRSVRGLCPFHSEKTPSFHVQPEKGLFKCFGCGESGDVISFVSKIEQASFVETLEKLAGDAGVVLQRERNAKWSQEESLRDQIFQCLEAAARLYEQSLWNDRLGGPSRRYLASRGVTDETARRFRLGAAPGGGESVFEVLVKKGFSVDVCRKAGLVSRSAAGRFYDPLFARLVFPIFDNFGHVIGFGGRVLPDDKKSVFGPATDDSGPKYLNSPETPVFSKGRTLYGLFQGKARMASERRALVLEGYMDVIGAHQGGFTFGVATLGTALTRDHARLMRRYADEVVTFFDPDEAGRRAALRGLAPLIQEGLYPRVVWTEGKRDPDELILEEGADAFQRLVDDAPDFITYMVRAAGGPDRSDRERASLGNEILALIAESPDELLKAEWTGRLATELGMRIEVLESQREKLKRAQPEPASASRGRITRPTYQIPTAEEELLRLVINARAVWDLAAASPVAIDEEPYRSVLREMQAQIRQSGELSLPALHDARPDAEKEWFLRMSLEETEFSDPVGRWEQLTRDLQIKNDRKRLGELSRRLANGAASPDEMEEYRTLLRRVKGSRAISA